MPDNEETKQQNGTEKEGSCKRSSRPLNLQSSFVRTTYNLTDGRPREFFWTCELSEENPEHTWDFEEEDDKEDIDYVSHNLYLRHVIVGKGAKEGERQLIEVETKNYSEEDSFAPLAWLNPGDTDQVDMDLNFSHEIPVKFRLAQGSGPVHLVGMHLAEIPQNDTNEENYEETGGETMDEAEVSESDDEKENVPEEDDDDEEEEEEEQESPSPKGKKRKAKEAGKKAKVRGKREPSASSDDEDDEDESMDEDYEPDFSPEKKKGKKRSKEEKKPSAKVLKARAAAKVQATTGKGKKKAAKTK